ncbi:hypothetical protein D3C81_1442090 [compost metagenome]
MLALQQGVDLRQQAVDRRLHRLQFARQRHQLQRFEGFRMAGADHPRHVLQWPQTPADGPPDQRGERHAGDQDRPEGVVDDALHQVLAHVVAFADPDQQPLLFVRQKDAAPAVTAGNQIEQAGRTWRRAERRGAG